MVNGHGYYIPRIVFLIVKHQSSQGSQITKVKSHKSQDDDDDVDEDHDDDNDDDDDDLLKKSNMSSHSVLLCSIQGDSMCEKDGEQSVFALSM